MAAQCRCGSELRNAFHSLGCLDCGSPLCPSCAITLESASYCPSCAGALLDAPQVRGGGSFDLH